MLIDFDINDAELCLTNTIHALYDDTSMGLYNIGVDMDLLNGLVSLARIGQAKLLTEKLLKENLNE